MLGAIWNAIGIIVGYMILIPLVIFIVLFVVYGIKEMIVYSIKAAAEVAEWIVGKNNKNN
jgi:ABC-type sugar transport system permease subunit